MIAIAVVYFVLSVGASVMFARGMDRSLDGPRLRALWAEGLTAQARCVVVRLEEAQDAEGGFVTHRHPTLEFRAEDGRTVTFEAPAPRVPLAVGDTVTVRYSAADPENATIRVQSFFIRHAKAVVICAGSVFALATASAIAFVP
ncbi:DUF3592 domain-containing protein [Streptomyces sp. NPDC058195]|uniref:DUF3592 domain-containing protein n=1 Tax=Streptomyces sp. NPDC058195 TaxID=3346375 RepID=UPI0036EB6154